MALNWIAQLTLLVAVVSVLGVMLGKVNIKGFTLGIGGVLFAGIIVAHFCTVYGWVRMDGEFESARHYLQEFGLILFVYAIGNSVGPSFFASLKSSGLKLVSIAVLLIVLNFIVMLVIFETTDVKIPELLGIYSGAITNTPALGAATQMVSDVINTSPATVKDFILSADALAQYTDVIESGDATALTAVLMKSVSKIGEGYAVAYPFGILGIFITLILTRLIFRIDINRAGQQFEEQKKLLKKGIISRNVLITKSDLEAKTVGEIISLFGNSVICSRMKRGSVLMVPHAKDKVAINDVLHLVGDQKVIDEMTASLGKSTDVSMSTKGTDMVSSRVVVTNNKIMGKKLGDLDLKSNFDVVISRFVRAGVELVPSDNQTVQFGDALNVVGRKEDVESITKLIGDSKQKMRQVYPLPLFLGISLGILLGAIAIPVPGIPAALKLGIAGGPLVMAILLSRFGSSLTFGKVHWFMHPAANAAIKEVGIVLFLACVGLKAGQTFVASVNSSQGLWWMFYGALITLIPLLIVATFATLVMKTNYLSLCGAISGASTDPPALAYSNGLYSSPEATSLAYATVYPFSMFLRILSPQVFVVLVMLIG